MTTKQAIGYILGNITFIIVALTVIALPINPKINTTLLPFIYFGQGIISGYLGLKIEREIKTFFE